MRGVEPHSPKGRSFQEITEPLRPATNDVQNRPARIRTRTSEVGARDAAVTPPAYRGAGPPGFAPGPTRSGLAMLAVLHHGPSESGRPGSNGPRRGGSPVLFRLSYVREMKNKYARLGSNQRPLPSRGSALSTELRAWGRSLRQDSNPHLGRTTGACLPLTLRRRETERVPDHHARRRHRRAAVPAHF
jgi:hypothetical protein